MKLPNIPSEFFTSFNNLIYYDEPHKYYVDNKQLISVTTLIHKYQEEFDEEYWSNYKSNQHNISQDDIKFAWKFINEKGTTKGSIIHDYAENLFNNKIFPYPKEEILLKFGYDAVEEEYLKTKKLIDQFYKDSFNKLIPIKTEFVIYDKEYGIGGMVDMLFYNIKTKQFQIYDWKTNKKYEKESEKYLSGKLMFLHDCEHTIYSLQLSAYKYIIEKYTGIKLGKSYLIWVSHKNDSYKIYEAENYENYIKIMFEDYKNNLI